MSHQSILHHYPGIGVAVARVNVGDPAEIVIHDVSDPADTRNFLNLISTPGDAQAVALNNGLAFVADGDAGLQVVNYLAYDTGNTPPTITLDTNFTGTDVVEGTIARITANVDDDVQVRNVEFFVNGESVLVDGTFPFEYRFVTPSIPSTLTITAVATDTGGNETTSGDVTMTSVEDAEPPTISVSSPGANELFTLLDDTLPVRILAIDNVNIDSDSISFTIDGFTIPATRTSFDTYELALPDSIGIHEITASWIKRKESA